MISSITFLNVGFKPDQSRNVGPAVILLQGIVYWVGLIIFSKQFLLYIISGKLLTYFIAKLIRATK